MIETVTDLEAKRIVRDCACSACWGSLIEQPAEPPTGITPLAGEHFSRAVCPVCKDATRGYVSRAFVERKLSESRAEAIEVRQALKGAMPSLALHLGNEAEIMESLGF